MPTSITIYTPAWIRRVLQFRDFVLSSMMDQADALKSQHISRLQSGDASVMAVLYDAYSASLFGVVIRIVHHHATAEDILQETFLRVWTRRDAFQQHKGSLFTWMLNIARNLAIDYLRSAAVQRTESVGITTSDSGHNDQHEQPDPQDQLESTDLLLGGDVVDMHQHVSTLPPDQQEIIQLVYFRGYTQSEIATEHNIPLGTVKSRLRLAMNTLRTIYGVSK